MITCPKCHHQVADDARFCGNCATPIVAAGASEDVELSDPFVGKCIDNKYYITERIAAGGMGVVYRATQKGVGQDVAIKRLHADFYQDPVIVKRFINEARSYGEITHPNAVKLHDLLNVNGQICIVMEYVKGRTLRDYIDNERVTPEYDPQALFVTRRRERMTVRSAENVVRKYTDGVSESHISPHKLRSTYATALYRATSDAYLVKDALGHKTLGVVQKNIAEDDANRRRASEKIGY